MREHDIVVALSNPDKVPALMRLGCMMANEFDGNVIAATVVTVEGEFCPDETSTSRMSGADELLRAAEQTATEMGARFEGRVAVSRGIQEVLDEIASARHAKAVVMGYSGHSRPTEGRKHDRLIDEVAAHVPCNLVVAKFRNGGTGYKKVLVPVARRLNMDVRRDLLAALHQQAGAQVDLVHFACDAEEAGKIWEDLQEWLVEREVNEWITPRVDIHTDPGQAIVDACRGYDAVLLGTPPLQTLRRRLFGSIPEYVAENAACTTLLIRQREGLRQY